MSEKADNPQGMQKESQGLGAIAPRAILDAIPEVVLVIDLNLKIVDVNKAFERTYDVTRADAIGKSCYELSHGVDEKCQPPFHLCPVDEILKTQEPLVALHCHHDEKLGRAYVELSAAPIFDERGEVVGIVEVVRDIVHRLSAKKVLLKSTEELERIAAEINAYLNR